MQDTVTVEFSDQFIVRLTVWELRVKDGLAVQRDRIAIAEEFADDHPMMLLLYNWPLLQHATVLVEVSSDNGETWREGILDRDLFLNMPEKSAVVWLEKVITLNPQHGLNWLDELKKSLTAQVQNKTS